MARPTLRPVHPLWTLLTAVAVALAVAACNKEPPVAATMADDEARQIVLDHADEVLTLTGWSGFSSSTAMSEPCSLSDGSPSRTVYRGAGSFQLLVPIEQQHDLVQRLADGWAQRGYQVSPVATFPGGGAQVTAVTPDDFFVDMTLSSGEPPAMALIIVTACYKRA